ncbi:hypothetical protein EXIGLDRAFT_772384 [Exidia glandulosa HHB12029]|uniref:Uncharacterized protein n=1 Tax=Exidia glandulosa HHB12029 TaxID=1314781 RepID=A0A165FD40_EXIGL|nr:hypothetical protein EXIGLDRAFT_772384 [Exidia glandulosa HHB12029]
MHDHTSASDDQLMTISARTGHHRHPGPDETRDDGERASATTTRAHSPRRRIRSAQRGLFEAELGSRAIVCRVFRRVVTPILYDHVAVDDDNYKYFATTASLPDTPLAHTRSVYFVSYEPDKVYSQASFEWLARALANVSTFTGPTRALYELSERVDELTLSSAYITDITLSGNIVHITDVQPVIQTLSSLHLIYEFCPEDLNQQPDLSSSHVEYLAIDMYSNLDVLDEDPLDLTPMIHLATSPSRLRRILCRPRFVQESDVQSAAQAIVAWATSQRDERVHIDDTFVRVGDTRSGWLWNKLDRQDAVDGNSVWFRGRQAWHPPSPTLDHSNSS